MASLAACWCDWQCQKVHQESVEVLFALSVKFLLHCLDQLCYVVNGRVFHVIRIQ